VGEEARDGEISRGGGEKKGTRKEKGTELTKRNSPTEDAPQDAVTNALRLNSIISYFCLWDCCYHVVADTWAAVWAAAMMTTTAIGPGPCVRTPWPVWGLMVHMRFVLFYSFALFFCFALFCFYTGKR
jgi:hypothetical protein